VGLRPKEDQRIKFCQFGTAEIRIGTVKRILRPEFYRHLKRVQYLVECDGEQLHIEPHEMIEYVSK